MMGKHSGLKLQEKFHLSVPIHCAHRVYLASNDALSQQ